MRYCLAALLVLAQLLLYLPSPVEAQSPTPLQWNTVDKPSRKGNVIVTPSEVSRIAVGRGDVLYAVDNANSRVYRSDNGGLTWTDITSGLISVGALWPIVEIACAPDSSRNIAAVTDGGTKVYLSNDSGATWIDTSIPIVSGNIRCIAISKSYTISTDVLWDIAVGTADWGNALSTGQVWAFQVGGSSNAWTNQNITVDPAHIGAEASAIAFSPNYDSEGTILVVASTGADVAAAYQNRTWLCMGKRDLSLQTTLWNGAAGYTGYPVQITPAGDAVGVTRITSSISLPSDYLSTDTLARIVFVSCDRQPSPAMDADDDVYMINNITVLRMNASGGVDIDITNISYYGTVATGKILAGDVVGIPPGFFAVQVRRSSFEPKNIVTAPSWYESTQPPSGPGNAVVSWSYKGAVAYCGTGQIPGVALDESAFSRSVDNGDTWEQTSLIDTVILISDIAPAPDSKSLFLATYSPFGVEGVWRSAGEPLGNFWGRVLTMVAASDRIILRLSPNYKTDYTICAAELNGGKMWISENRGNSWQLRWVPGIVNDIVLEDKDTIYVALPGGLIRKSITAGRTWKGPVSTELTAINMLSLADKEHILVGSRDGRAAYSLDGGKTFTEIVKAVFSGTGDVQVVADSNYQENRTIYAGANVADEGIWRWTIDLSSEWEQIDEPVTLPGTGQSISGLLTGTEGTLYALRSEPVNGIGSGGMTRSLNPSNPVIIDIEFDIINATLPVGATFDPTLIFPNAMPLLKLSGDSMQNQLWTFNPSNNLIYRFQDTLCKTGPMTFDTGVIGCDPASGRNQEFSFTWEQLSLSDEYELHVAKDDIFSLRMQPVEPATSPFYLPPVVTSPAYFVGPGRFLECGHSYYWRTRTRHAATGETIRSPWSDTKKFIVKAGFMVTLPYYGPQLLSPDNDCGCPCNAPVCFSWSPFKETSLYRFELSENSDMSNPLLATNISGTTAFQYNGRLKCNTNYFWRVMAMEPAPSEWSAVFSFMTGSRTQLASLPPLPEKVTPIWNWVIIGLGAAMVIFILILILKTRGNKIGTQRLMDKSTAS